MTSLMRRAIDEAAKLDDSGQDAIATIVLREIESERCWEDLFARPESHEALAKLADAALASNREGRSRPLDMGDL